MPEIQNIPTTQYVGPRIIPHLWDPILWDASTQYDALAVVQYNGVPYVARYVPPQGTLPTDTTYWVRWADFNAQMAQLQDTVESFDNRITANATAVETEATARESADTTLTTLISDEISNEASARTEADADIQTQINAMRAELFYNVLDYGAKGDGTTDDTAAIQSAINDCAVNGTVYFPTGRGQCYKVTSTLNITTAFVKVVCDEVPSLGWVEHGIKFYAPTENSILFNVNASGITFSNILASSTTRGMGIFAHCRYNAPDTDVAFNNIDIVNFKIGIQHYNRGLKLFNSTMAQVHTCVEIYCDSYITNSGQNNVRGIEISGNRLHNMYEALHVYSVITNGLQFQNNLIDFFPEAQAGNALIADDSADTTSLYYGLTVTGNTVLNCGDFAIDIRETNSAIISGNTFVNRSFAAKGFIRIRNVATSSLILNNIFGTCYFDAIYVRTLYASSICNNTMNAVARDASGSNYAGIRFTTMSGSSIIGNLITLMTPANSYPIVCDGDGNYTNNIIQNNTSRNQSAIVYASNGATFSNSVVQSTITA